MKPSQRRAMFARLARRQTVTPPPFSSANRLPVQVSVLVPSTERDTEISTKRFSARVDAEKRWFDARFGGDTAINDVGSYLLDGKKLVKERGVVVEASTTTETYEKYRKEFARHVAKRSKDWNQQTILAGVEGQKFIVPKQSFIDSEKKPSKRIWVT